MPPAALVLLLSATLAPFAEAVDAPFDAAKYAVHGLDVSHHQGRLDWPAVAREPGLSFVFLKATQGARHVDAEFARNWAGARAAGLRVGAYHYFSFCTPAAAQAAHFLAVLPRDPGMLPPVLDVEHLRNCPPPRDPEAVRRELRLWLATVERATNRRPIVYATSDVLVDYVLGAIDVPLFVRHTPEDPESVRDLPWLFLQHDDQHIGPGTATTVDRDVFAGDLAALEALARPVKRRSRLAGVGR